MELNYINKISSKVKRVLILLSDLLTAFASYYLSFYIRFEGSIPPDYMAIFWKCLPVVVILRISLFYFFGLYRGMWRYASIHDLKAVLYAVSLGSIAIIMAVSVIFGLDGYPRSTILIEWLLAIVLIGSSRFAVRTLRSISLRTASIKRRIIIVGGGDVAEMLLREIYYHQEIPYKVIGLVDDEPSKQGKMIHGVKVLGPIKDLEKVINVNSIDEVIIAIYSASGRTIRRILEHCQNANVKFRMLPALRELIDGTVTVNHLHEVKFEDLLGRQAHHLDLNRIGKLINDKRVMITGAAGSIGSEICRQISSLNPGNLILIDHAENALYHLKIELNKKNYKFDIFYIIGDITDEEQINKIVADFCPQIVFHAAAYKHVPMMESNKAEAIRNNVMGTKILAEAASQYGVENFVMISTDKAVNPTSAMGVSKRISELFVQGFQPDSATKFITVRFGNVLGSNGSVIPHFQQQIAAGGPVTVTHPSINRYFMTIQEAVQLVLESAVMGKGSEIYILEMGEPINILDLARNLITLSGYKPEEDIEIIFTGLRPGEKLHEELWLKEEKIVSTSHSKIMEAQSISIDRTNLNNHIDQLIELLLKGCEKELVAKLIEIVPTYNPEGAMQQGQKLQNKNLNPLPVPI